ncbi:hypothetical protein XO11_01840 [Marinitoga sp. 1138]|nr:hypothetical protein [Marinitoga sp. 1138]NUU96981.1 hypothetical protein [Marinitoga sp. 1138]
MGKRERVYLSVEEMPKYWYNALADLPFELDPPLNPQTKEIMKPEELEAIFSAPESSHAIAGAIKEAIEAKENKEEKVIVFTLSGHGLLDLTAYS